LEWPASPTRVTNTPLSFAFAIPCFNEAQNLPVLLPILDRTRVDGRAPSRFVIVSDASKDGTNEIVAEFASATSTPVKLIANERRGGKPAAVNRCIRELNDIDIIVLLSGDVLPKGDCVSLLVKEFANPSVGVAAARPVPLGVEGNFAFEITRLMWSLHHIIATRYPKSTEITAFRNVIEKIDPTTFVDEAALELALERKGFVTRYLSQAEILSPSPLRLADYLKQRAVVTLGYLRMHRKEGHRMKTLSLFERLRAISVVSQTQKIRIPILLLAIVMEIIVRAWAWIQFLAGSRSHGIWGRSESTKRRLVYEPELTP
jgi:glycosyltransferase involved in cell wall biosynthesis